MSSRSSSTASSVDSLEETSSPSSSLDGSPYRPPQVLIDEYQALLSTTLRVDDLRLNGFLPTHPVHSTSTIDLNLGTDDTHPDGRAMTKAEKQNAKKKRRREREREAKAQAEGGTGQSVQSENATLAEAKVSTVAFRLFSSCPLGSVALATPEEVYSTPSNPRHRSFSAEEAATRHHQAQVAAVHWPDLGGPSNLAERWTKSSRTTRTLYTDQSIGPSRILVASLNRPNSGNWTSSLLPSGVTKTIPLLACREGEGPRKKVRRSRTKRREHNQEAQAGVTSRRGEAIYYRPPDGLGGKSMSTLWGHGLGMDSRL